MLISVARTVDVLVVDKEGVRVRVREMVVLFTMFVLVLHFFWHLIVMLA
jgi:hypothetical protein